MRRSRRQYLTGIALRASWRERPVDSPQHRALRGRSDNGRSTRRSLLSIRPSASRGRGARRASVSAGLAITLAAALSTASAASAASAANAASAAGAGAPAGQPGRLLSSLALGLNAAPWDYIYAADVSAGGGLDTIQPLLQAADIGLLRYGGGSYADYYDSQTNTDIQTCIWGIRSGVSPVLPSLTTRPRRSPAPAATTPTRCPSTSSHPRPRRSARAAS